MAGQITDGLFSLPGRGAIGACCAVGAIETLLQLHRCSLAWGSVEAVLALRVGLCGRLAA
jgi:hypothetical protein